MQASLKLVKMTLTTYATVKHCCSLPEVVGMLSSDKKKGM